MLTTASSWTSAAEWALAKRSVLVRWLLAGPGAVGSAIVATAAMPLWLPEGSAGVDHIVLPIVLFPAVWAVIFFYSILETNQLRALITLSVALLLNTALVVSAFMGNA